MEKHILSKSTFIRGLQCQKSLFLYKNFIQLRDKISPEQRAIFNRGNNVGLLAQKLFPRGTDATLPNRSNNIASIEKTKQLIESGTEVIYEATFQHEQVLVILDILVKKNNQWYAYEVKSSIKISQTYVRDASLQYFVITMSGLPLQDISLITVNGDYKRNGELNIQELFSIKSVKREAVENQKIVEENIVISKNTIANPQMPKIKIGEHCFSPYRCDFMGQCWKDVPKDSVFEITGVSKEESFAMYNNGIKTVSQIPEINNLNRNINEHILSFRNDEIKIDSKAIKKFLSQISYPISFLDFETFMPAVPIYNQTKPYQHIPFQYSLHYKENRNAELKHFAFLAETGVDPRKHFLESLLKDAGSEGSIPVYDSLMERNVLNSLKKDFPEYSSEIDLILNRIIDIMIPFQEKMYYHHSMKNSFSIKNILPSLVPKFNYSDLKISSGNIAMTVFENLQTENDMFKILELRENLLEYCKMDTFAMVKIFEVLENIE